MHLQRTELQVNNMQIFGLCIFKFANLEAKLFINILSEAENGQNLESCWAHPVLIGSSNT